MGSPAFAVPPLRALVEAGYRVVEVVTQPDRPAGRGGALRPPPVKQAGLELGLPVFQPETLKDPAARERLQGARADVFVVAAYGKLLAPAVLAMPGRGAVNVHASLLPRWRGASPIAAAILAGDAETGVSIMEMVKEMDAGPVIRRAALPVLPGDTTGSLEPRLSQLGARTLVEALPAWYDGQLRAEPQDASQATFCRILDKADGHLRADMTASEAERAVRAYHPWPGAFVLYRGERLAIWAARAADAPPGARPGQVVLVDRLPAVCFREGALVLDEVQRTGARRLSGRDFLNGERGAPAPEAGLA
jgi:methionyl-tRNA formyltransferase